MRRTYIKDTTKRIGQRLKVAGWVNTVRSHGKILFIDLRDITGILQVVFFPQNKAVYDIAKDLRPEWVVEITGKISERPKNMQNPRIETGEVEMQAEELNILSKAKTPPIPVNEQEAKETNLDKRMDFRWLDLRRPEKLFIFKVWTKMEEAFREYWLKNEYLEIHSPKLMSAPSESGAELFEVKYFKRKAYLAQSPQFYKQMAMAAGFEKVFEVGPVFRADPSATSRHATEFTGYDMEISFIDSHQDIIQEEEKIIVFVLTKIKKEFGKEIEKFYNRKLDIPKIPFPQITLKEAKNILSGLKISSEKEGDLNPEEERKICEYIFKKYKHEFVFITEYPIEARPFYHMRFEDKPGLTKSFDLLWQGLEITTGAQREHRYNVLVKQAKEKGLNLKPIKYYLNFFKYGCPPHGGLGLGPARMMLKILNISNIREVSYLFRGMKRLDP